MKKETIRCSECKYCGFLSSLRGTRNTFHCGHPDGSYINRYFMEHGIRKAPGFLGFGKPYSRKVPLKTSPAWCPLKQEKEGIHCERYCGIECVNGHCPIACRDELIERGMDVPKNCGDCPERRGCEDCAFNGTDICIKNQTDRNPQ